MPAEVISCIYLSCCVFRIIFFFFLHYSLIDALQRYVDAHGIVLAPQYFDQLGEVQLVNSQAIAVWKNIVVYQDKQRRGM